MRAVRSGDKAEQRVCFENRTLHPCPFRAARPAATVLTDAAAGAAASGLLVRATAAAAGISVSPSSSWDAPLETLALDRAEGTSSPRFLQTIPTNPSIKDHRRHAFDERTLWPLWLREHAQSPRSSACGLAKITES